MGFEPGRLRQAIAAALLAIPVLPALAQETGGRFASPYPLEMEMRRAAAPIRTCPQPPAPMRDLRIESGFASGDYTKLVPERVARRQALTKRLHAYVGDVVDLSDRAMLLKGEARQAAADCVLAWLRAWLGDGALLGDVTWPEGHYEREWVSIALGLSLLKLQAGEVAVQAPEWARNWYLQASSELADRYPLSAELRNNHWYWAGLASVVAGTVAGDRGRYDWGIAQLHAGIGDIDGDGFLPLELKRGEMSLRYTAFAASALVVMAAFEQANGRPLTETGQESIRRLVRRVLSGLADPAEFERRAGARQEKFDPGVVRLLAWLEIYFGLTGDPEAEPWLRHLRPMKLMWLGGDVTMAFGRRIAPGPVVQSPLIGR
ncbi:alginate lyase family protein [Mesorhizobium sp. KR9-304]|uniref:alginate lyase family protein n=1 Tax=Mesorhizobium sp. KR9-304 TaxID=3156614 RepID=UPI0032B5C75A